MVAKKSNQRQRSASTRAPRATTSKHPQLAGQTERAPATDLPLHPTTNQVGEEPVARPDDETNYEPAMLKRVVVGRRTQHRIDLRLAFGSVAEVSCRAVVLGVFRDVAPSGPAKALNDLLDNVIVEFTRRRMFSARVGEIFIMPTLRHRLRTEMVLFAGMGSFDGLSDSVQQLVAENTIRTCIRTGIDEFATVLIGSGSGQSIAESLENLVRGFIRGLLDADTDHRFRGITLCEVNEDRYRVIRQELYRLVSTSLFAPVEVTFDEVTLPSVDVSPANARTGPSERQDPIYLIVRREPQPEHLIKRTGVTRRVMVREGTASQQAHVRRMSEKFILRASLLTAGGKATVMNDAIEVDGRILDAHLGKIESRSFRVATMPKFGRELAELVLPPTVLEALPELREHHLVVVNDASASRVPWETIHIGGWSPAAHSGLTRRYLAENISVAKWLDERRLGPKISILCVVNPTGDLAAADREGQRLRELLGAEAGFEVAVMTGDEATHSGVKAAFNSGHYDIIHYAGHAFFDDQQRLRSGIVCADGKVLSGADIGGLSRLPCLVVFNACEAARVRNRVLPPADQWTIRERISRSISFAEAYLRGGVANFIGTYWPVDDHAAELFARTFYNSILHGATLGSALQKSRNRLQQSLCVDWADYIHYGDHDFELKPRA